MSNAAGILFTGETLIPPSSLAHRLRPWIRRKLQDTAVQVDACLGYMTKTVATGPAAVRSLLEEFVEDPAKAKLMIDTNSGEFIDPSEPTLASAGVHLATRTPVSHFAALLGDQTVDKLVRVTLLQQEEFGHLVALGSDGFFLCTCLRQLVYGLVCPHGLKAMFDNTVNKFNGASFAPRWRESGTPWTLEALASKPAMLERAGAECPVQLPPFDLNMNDMSHSGSTVKAAAYSNGVSMGKDMGVRLREIDSLEGIDRVLESTKIFFNQQLEVEKRSQLNASMNQVFTGVTSQSTHGDGMRTTRARGGTGSTPRGRGQGGKGGRGARQGRGGVGSGAGSGGVATGMPAPIPAAAALQPPAAAAMATATATATIGAAPASVPTKTTNGAHMPDGSSAPLRTLSNMEFPGGMGGEASSTLLPPANYAVLERVLAPRPQRQTGSSKRMRSGGIK